MFTSKTRPHRDWSSLIQAVPLFWKRNNKGFTLVEILLSLLLISIAVIPFLKYFTDSAQMELFTRRELTSDYIAQKTLEEVKAGKLKVTDVLNFNKGVYVVRVTKTPISLFTPSGSVISSGDVSEIALHEQIGVSHVNSSITVSSYSINAVALLEDFESLSLLLDGNSGATTLNVRARDSANTWQNIGQISLVPDSAGINIGLMASGLEDDIPVTLSNASSVVLNVYTQTDGGNGFVITQNSDENQEAIVIQYGALSGAAESTNLEKTYHIVVEIYQDNQLIEYVDSILRE